MCAHLADTKKMIKKLEMDLVEQTSLTELNGFVMDDYKQISE